MTYPWTAGEVLLAADLNSAFAAKSDLAMVQNAQTGSSYSYALADASKLLSMSNASANTVLVTKQATVTWVTGTQLRVLNLGAGVTTLVADTGVTINGNVALKQYQGGTLIRTASDVWLFVPTASSSGMDLITPTSVAGSGVTLSGGQVTFTAATTASVNGVFSGSYDNYLVACEISSATASGQSTLRLRVSGVDSSTGYQTGIMYVTYSTGTVTGGGTPSYGTTSFGPAYVNSTYGATFSYVLFSPALARRTTMAGNSGNLATDFAAVGGSHTVATAYDGLTLASVSGNITGTLRIYGLRNS